MKSYTIDLYNKKHTNRYDNFNALDLNNELLHAMECFDDDNTNTEVLYYSAYNALAVSKLIAVSIETACSIVSELYMYGYTFDEIKQFIKNNDTYFFSQYIPTEDTWEK